MTLLLWLAMGILGGILARQIIPKMETDNAVFAVVIAIIGSLGGGFTAALLGVQEGHIISNLALAFGGAILVLFFYRQYLSDAIR